MAKTYNYDDSFKNVNSKNILDRFSMLHDNKLANAEINKRLFRI